MDTKEIFRPDRNQALAVVAVLGAVFTFAEGEILLGFVCFGAAAILSLGGLFWSAHRADRAARLAANAVADGDAPPAAPPPMSQHARARVEGAPPATGAITPANKEPQ